MMAFLYRLLLQLKLFKMETLLCSDFILCVQHTPGLK